MKAVTYESGKVVVRDVAAPSGPGVRVQITSAGICGSDLMMLDTGFGAAASRAMKWLGVCLTARSLRSNR